MNCDDIKKYMSEYIDGTLDDSTKEDMACHLDTCDDCFNELKAVDKTIWSLKESSRNISVPSDYLDSIEETVAKGYKPGARKAGKFFWIYACVLICAMFIGGARLMSKNLPGLAGHLIYGMLDAAAPGKLYNTDYGTYGRKLNISSTNNGIRITAVKIVADDVGTLIYFKVDNPENKIFMPGEVSVHSVAANWGRVPGSKTGEFVVYTRPLDSRNKYLDVSISYSYSTDSDGSGWQEIPGKWSFNIPVQKLDINVMKSRSYDLDSTVNLGDYAIIFKKFISAPSGSYIVYNYVNNGSPGGITINNINMQYGERKLEHLDYFGGTGRVTGNTFVFESVYPSNPKDIKPNILSYIRYVMDSEEKKVSFNLNGPFPVNFDYLGNKLSINKLDTEMPDKFVQFELDSPKGPRNFYDLAYSFGDMEHGFFLDGHITDYYVEGENGVEYDYNVLNYQEYEDKDLIMYPVKTVFSFEPQMYKDTKKFTLTIFGHTSKIMLNNTIEIDLK